jgi:hypothetical protein
MLKFPKRNDFCPQNGKQVSLKQFYVDKYNFYMCEAQARARLLLVCHYVLMYIQTEYLR